LAAILALWFMVIAAEGLGFAVPRHPSVLDPTRSRAADWVLITVILVGLGAAIIMPLSLGNRLALGPLSLVIAAAILVPIWELATSAVYRGSIIVINALEETARPVVVASVSEVFGTVVEEKDMLLAADWEGDDFRLLVDGHSHLMVLNPTFIVPQAKIRLLMTVLAAKLKTIKAPGFNERSFWIAFALPLALTVLYAAIAFDLLSPVTHIALRGTLGR
jgi:hypothetical protein